MVGAVEGGDETPQAMCSGCGRIHQLNDLDTDINCCCGEIVTLRYWQWQVAQPRMLPKKKSIRWRGRYKGGWRRRY
jgi:hypothetical protein